MCVCVCVCVWRARFLILILLPRPFLPDSERNFNAAVLNGRGSGVDLRKNNGLSEGVQRVVRYVGQCGFTWWSSSCHPRARAPTFRHVHVHTHTHTHHPTFAAGVRGLRTGCEWWWVASRQTTSGSYPSCARKGAIGLWRPPKFSSAFTTRLAAPFTSPSCDFGPLLAEPSRLLAHKNRTPGNVCKYRESSHM